MDLADIYRLMRNAHIQAQSIVDTLPEPLLVLNDHLCVESASRSFYAKFKVTEDETLGRPIHELGGGLWDIPQLRHLLQDVIPRSTAIVDYEVTQSSPGGRRTLLVSAHRLFEPGLPSQRILLSIVDATEARKRQAESDLLVGELRHRIKNLLAMVQAIARQTVTEGRSAEEYRNDFLGRFAALTTAHELAFSKEGAVGLRTLIDQTLRPYVAEPGRVVAEPGPPVMLAPAQIMPISLVLHELATNAMKHGGLSVPEGRVELLWDVSTESAPQLRLRWQERGGPPTEPPTTVGFGTRLVDFVVRRELGGRVELEYLPAGLTVEIVIPTP